LPILILILLSCWKYSFPIQHELFKTETQSIPIKRESFTMMLSPDTERGKQIRSYLFCVLNSSLSSSNCLGSQVQKGAVNNLSASGRGCRADKAQECWLQGSFSKHWLLETPLTDTRI
jgi:hypothetical protein